MLNWFIVRFLYSKNTLDTERHKLLQVPPPFPKPPAPAHEVIGSHVFPAEGNHATASTTVSKIQDVTDSGFILTSKQTFSPRFKDTLWREPAFNESPFPFMKNWCSRSSSSSVSDCMHLVEELQKDFRSRYGKNHALSLANTSQTPLDILYAQCQRDLGVFRMAPTLDKMASAKEKNCREHVIKLAEHLAKPS